MKIAVILSGTIRSPENSLASLAMLRKSQADVDVFMHCWSKVGDVAKDSWSGLPTLELTNELIERYPVDMTWRTSSWASMRNLLEQKIIGWRSYSMLQNETMCNGLAFLGQFWSLQQAWCLIHKPIARYDVIVRLRFDTLLLDNPLDHLRQFGFVVPTGSDWGGMNDQLAWFNTGGYPDPLIEYKAGAYFNLIDHIEPILRSGGAFHPETMMLLSIMRSGQTVLRVPFRYEIRGKT